MNAATLAWNSSSLPKSRLRDKPLVPFTTEGLRTGDCLVRLQWCERTHHITFAAYERLQAKLSEYKSPLVCSEPPDIVEEPAESEPDWILGHDEPFNPGEWAVVPLVESPKNPQVSPAPICWDSSVDTHDPEIYPLFPQEYYSSLFRPQLIPNLRKKTSARTAEGLRRFKEKMKLQWAERKTLSDKWRKIVPYNDHQSESFGEPETPLHCPRCGCGIFDRKIVCRDCGWDMRGYAPKLPPQDESRRQDEEGNEIEPKAEIWTNDQDEETAIESDLIQRARKGRRKREKIPLDTMIRLLLVRQDGLDKWFYGEGLTQAANMARLLTPEFSGSVNLMTKDIAEETGESVNTIDSRVTRLLADQEKYTDRELRRVTPVQVVDLALSYPMTFRKVTGYQGRWNDIPQLLEFVVTRMLEGKWQKTRRGVSC